MHVASSFIACISLLAHLASTSTTTTDTAASSRTPKYVFAHHIVGNTYPYNISDWLEDVDLAHQYDIDAFALNVGSDSWQPARVADAYMAAQQSNTGFKLFLSLDMRYAFAPPQEPSLNPTKPFHLLQVFFLVTPRRMQKVLPNGSEHTAGIQISLNTLSVTPRYSSPPSPAPTAPSANPARQKAGHTSNLNSRALTLPTSSHPSSSIRRRSDPLVFPIQWMAHSNGMRRGRLVSRRAA